MGSQQSTNRKDTPGNSFQTKNIGEQAARNNDEAPVVSSSPSNSGGDGTGVSPKREPTLSMKMVIGGIKLKWPSVVNMSTETLHQRIEAQDTSLVILDARPEEEFSVSHIAHARRVHPEAVDVDSVYNDIITSNGDESKTIVCYCSVGYRSAVYASALNKNLKQGKPNSTISVFNLEGSLFKWANENRPMVDCTGAATTWCHTYSATWGKLLKPQCRYKDQEDS